MSDNPALKAFIEMRRSLHKEEKKPVASRNKTGTKNAMVESMTEASLAKILETKPGKKDVSDFFQRECDRLTTEKMK